MSWNFSQAKQQRMGEGWTGSKFLSPRIAEKGEGGWGD